ncbi:MAG: prolyl oligopeptidase family serine peptidase [Verrucomicrobiales bacterium]
MNFYTRSLSLALLAIGMLAPQAQDKAPAATANQAPQKVSKEIKRTVSSEYLLFLPEGYEKETSKKWPLIVFLHGAGERGTDLSKVAVHGPPKLVKSRPDFPFIVASPQCPPGKVWDKDTVLALKDEVVSKYRVDKERIYLTGLSMGGYGTWDVLTSHPEAFAAYAPICGGGLPIRIWLGEGKYREALRQAPVWAFHGAKDSIVPLMESERMISALKNSRSEKAKLTVYPEANHDSWTVTYDNQELYDWFLQHKLQPTSNP